MDHRVIRISLGRGMGTLLGNKSARAARPSARVSLSLLSSTCLATSPWLNATSRFLSLKVPGTLNHSCQGVMRLLSLCLCGGEWEGGQLWHSHSDCTNFAKIWEAEEAAIEQTPEPALHPGLGQSVPGAYL